MSNKLRLLAFVVVLIAVVPLTLALALQPHKNTSHAQVLSANVTNNTSNIQGKNELTCSDCVQQGKDGICFNVESKSAYCANTKGITTGVNVLCRSCGSTKPSPTISITPPPTGCYYKPVVCTLMCPQNNPNCCGDRKVLICPSTTPSLTCIPRPTCLDTTPHCMIAEPAGGWCPRTAGIHSSVNPQPTQ